MLRSICCDEEDICSQILDLEMVICKVYFPQIGEHHGRAITWPTTSSCQQEIRKFHIGHHNKSFRQFFDLVSSSIMDSVTDIALLVQDADKDWIPVDSEVKWAAILDNVHTLSPNKQGQLRIKVLRRDGSCVTIRAPASPKKKTTNKRNVSCCIIPTKTEAYPCMDSNFLSIRQDFGTLQKQMEAMRLKEEQEKKKKKKTTDKKKRSSKSAEIVNHIAYHAEIYNNWSPNKWKRENTIAVL